MYDSYKFYVSFRYDVGTVFARKVQRGAMISKLCTF